MRPDSDHFQVWIKVGPANPSSVFPHGLGSSRSCRRFGLCASDVSRDGGSMRRARSARSDYPDWLDPLSSRSSELLDGDRSPSRSSPTAPWLWRAPLES